MPNEFCYCVITGTFPVLEILLIHAPDMVSKSLRRTYTVHDCCTLLLYGTAVHYNCMGLLYITTVWDFSTLYCTPLPYKTTVRDYGTRQFYTTCIRLLYTAVHDCCTLLYTTAVIVHCRRLLYATAVHDYSTRLL